MKCAIELNSHPLAIRIRKKMIIWMIFIELIDGIVYTTQYMLECKSYILYS